MLLHGVQGSEARLEMLSTSCPLEQQQQWGPLRTRTLTSHHIKNATFGTLAGDLSLPWMNHLSSLLQLPAPTIESPVAVSEASTHLSLEDCALAYMPPNTPVVDPNCTAFVAYARGLHTYTLGSARHVDITAANVAVGRVRSGGVAPWACEQPAAGWSERTCASLGLEAFAKSDALSVLLDNSAAVDSEARDDSRPRSRPPSSAPDGDTRFTLHGLAEVDALSGGHIDPLLQQVRRKQAAEAQRTQCAAEASGLYSSVRSEAATVLCSPVLQAPVAQSARIVGGSQEPCRRQTPDAACETLQGSGHSRGDSDMEVLSGKDACMMAIMQVQLQQLLVTLTPDTCTLVSHLAEQLSAQYITKATEAPRMAPDRGGGETSGPSTCSPRRSRAFEEERAATCETAALPMLCSQLSEVHVHSQEPTMGETTEQQSVREDGLAAAHSAAPQEPVATDVCSQELSHQAPNSSNSDNASACSLEDSQGQPQESLEGSDVHRSAGLESASSDPYHSLGNSQMPLAQTVFQDASSMIISSDSGAGSTAANGCEASCSHASGYHSAMATTSTPARYPRISPLPHSPDFMHDMDLAGESVVAVGTLAESQLHAAGVPSEQEDDGLVAPDLQQASTGLLGSVMEDYVSQHKPSQPSSAAEPVLGRLGVNYPDSCRRLAVSAAGISVLLRPDGIMSTDYAAAASMVGKGLVRLEVSGARMQHDQFADGGSSRSRLAARVRSIEMHQAGFLTHRSQHPASSAGQGGVKWRPLAAHLKQGPSDPRHDVLRLLLQVGRNTEGSQEASVVLRLPSLRLHLEQPVLLFLKVCFSLMSHESCTPSEPVRSHSTTSCTMHLFPGAPPFLVACLTKCSLCSTERLAAGLFNRLGAAKGDAGAAC